MLALALAISIQLAPRPDALVVPGEEAAYAEFLRLQAIGVARNWTGEFCPEATISDISTTPFIVGELPQMPAVKERVSLEGCGSTSIQNMHVVRFDESEPWRIRGAVPGETRIELAVQNAMFSDLFSSVGKGLTDGCSPIFVTDTYVAANPGYVDFEGAEVPLSSEEPRISLAMNFSDSQQLETSEAWAEVWKINMCGENRTTMIVFIPTKSGSLRPQYLPIYESTAVGDLPKRANPAP